MQPTIFTQIITGAIPSHKLFEDETTFAFLDIHPVQPGHTIVVPKRSVEFVWDLPTDDYQQLMDTCRAMALRLRASLNVPYVSQRIIGVDVPHAHVHLIPFTAATELEVVPSANSEPDHATLAQLAQALAF